jgi:alkanesulfonate monooxygenase SsuD/methylene tetrahydromethanopterin reductase-like flavin-dependent oxidoreductase (luciferase family)
VKVKFSIFFEMQIANPTPSAEAQLFHDCVEQAVLADELGYHAVWEVEHHGLYEYSHSSAPEVFLAYLAAKTRRIRLGHGVTLLPHRYNHPIRVAERLATLDVLSGGRVLWGTGKSASLVEQGAFEAKRELLDAEWREALEMIPRMWASEPFEHHSATFDIPPTQILPKPIQRPHPPIYMACASETSALRAGELGLGALNFAFGKDDMLREKVRAYRQAVEQARPSAWQKTNHFACTPAALVLEDDARACAYGLRGARFFMASLSAYYFSGTRPVGPLDVPRDFLSEQDVAKAVAARNAGRGPVSALVGEPARVRELVDRYVAIGVDELIMVMQMGTVPQALILESLRTFAEKVMPYYA